MSAAQQAQRPDATERQHVIAAAAANVERHYFDKALGRKMAEALRSHAKNGDDNATADGDAFARLLTQQMRDVSHDMHLEVIYSADPLPVQRPAAAPSAEDLARFRARLQQDNCTFRKVENLPHNIGYLKFDWFADLDACRATATAAMTTLNNADALIIDLRDNRGGSGDMVTLVAGYFFDHPEYIFDPRELPSIHSWTRSPVAGNKLADKPVYLLTSSTTISAAEDFTYNLKMLRRVTIVGETTAGGAHAGVFYRIDDHFGMAITEVQAVNPYSTVDWEGVGVEPDVKIKADEALETAKKLAEDQLRFK
jgi:C-terminal processing protease CtpA/Prc